MRKFLAIIIDDQKSSIDYLLEHFEHIEYVEIIESFQDPTKASSFLRRNRIDFIILDVELGKINGFDFLSSLPNPNIPTILHTAYTKFEDLGYELNLIDVLLKPVSLIRLKGALRRVHHQLHNKLDVEDSLEHWCDYITVKGPARYERHLVWFKNIVFIESQDRKLLIHQIDQQTPLISNSTLSNLLDKLPGKWFMQCHQSYIFNINFFKRYHNGTVYLKIKKDTLPVGDRSIYTDFDRFLENEGNLC